MDRIYYEKLAEKLSRAASAYYDNDDPIMSDYEYDDKMRELRKIEAEHPEWILDISPTQKVAGTSGKSTFEKVAHAVPMLSLQDVFSKEEVESFLANFDANTVFSVEEKIDGLSLSATYINGILSKGETRGDGYIGEDITENVKHIIGLPLKLKTKNAPELLEVRCEVYMPVAEYERINKQKEENGEKLFANPRNAAAGILRTKDIEAVKQARLHAFVFNIQRISFKDNTPDDFNSHIKSLNAIKAMEFNVVAHYTATKKDAFDVVKNIGNYKNSLEYWIDGAVIKLDDINLRKNLGDTIKYPRWAIAYKYPPEEKETVIRSIIIQTGRTGRLTPVAVFDPILLAGTTVGKATLHNPQILAALDARVGDTVVVRKAAEIIPEIVKVNKNKRPEGTAPFVIEKCPECGTAAVADEEGNGAFCPNVNCPAQIFRHFEFWASRDCMDIMGLGPALIEKFIDLGWLKSIPDIYRLKDHYDDMKEMDGFGEKAASKLLKSIEESKKRDIDRLIKALGISGVGRHIGKKLATMCANIDDVAKLDRETLLKIDGVGEISADMIIQYFKNPENQNMIKELKSLGVNTISQSFNAGTTDKQKLSGKTFVITGSFPSMSRDEMTELIEKNGGKTSGSVSKKTSYLICGENAGSKLDKAKELNIPVLSEPEFLNMLK